VGSMGDGAGARAGRASPDYEDLLQSHLMRS